MIQAFIFDIGGVLVKNDEALLEAIFLSLRQNGLDPQDRETVLNAFGQSNYINVETAVRTCYSGADFSATVDRCMETFKAVFPLDVASSFEIFPGNLDVLTQLKNKGFKLAVFTGLSRLEAEVSLDSVGVKTFFDAIVTLDDVEHTRPNPEGLQRSAEKLGCSLQDCIYVGDTVADIQMAHNANVPIVCVKTGVQSNDVLAAEVPDYFLENLGEMFAALKLTCE